MDGLSDEAAEAPAPPLPPPAPRLPAPKIFNSSRPNICSIVANAESKWTISERLLEVELCDIQKKIGRIVQYDFRKSGASEALQWKVDARFRHSSPVLQIGPTCGFAAIALVGQLASLRNPNEDFHNHMQSMISWAREQGYTSQGEMFYALHLQSTLQKFYSCPTKLHRITAKNDNPDFEAIMQDFVQFVEEGNVILMPYDKGPNHEPAFKKGNSAHWCLVHGIVKFTELRSKGEQEFSSHEIVYVLCRQGQSLQYGVWKLIDLIRSCLELERFNRPEGSYVLPDDKGLNELRGHVILVKTESEIHHFSCESADL